MIERLISAILFALYVAQLEKQLIISKEAFSAYYWNFLENSKKKTSHLYIRIIGRRQISFNRVYLAVHQRLTEFCNA